MPDSEPGEGSPHLASLGGGGGGEPRAQPRAARVDAQLAPCLRIDEPELPRVRELVLARVADLDGDDVVPARELEQRPAPVARPAEVGDDDHERPLPCERAGPLDRRAERGIAVAVALLAERGQ